MQGRLLWGFLLSATRIYTVLCICVCTSWYKELVLISLNVLYTCCKRRTILALEESKIKELESKLLKVIEMCLEEEDPLSSKIVTFWPEVFKIEILTFMGINLYLSEETLERSFSCTIFLVKFASTFQLLFTHCLSVQETSVFNIAATTISLRSLSLEEVT